MSKLNCAVCGSHEVTQTIDTEEGIAALCGYHYSFVLDQAAKLSASEDAARRMKAREAGL